MSSAAKVGIFMIVVLAILGYLILRIEDVKIGAEPTKRISAVFENVAGLNKKSDVRVAGVRQGTVIDMALVDGRRALVTLEIDADVVLYRNASARVENMGLLGEKFVVLDPGTPDAGPRAEGSGPLAGSELISIDQVTAQISEIATDVKAITGSLRKSMGGPEGEQRMEEIIENVRQITAQVRAIIEANQSNVNATAANLRQITDDLRVEIPKIAASIDRVAGSIGGTVNENREDVRMIVENLKTLSADLKVTADNLNEITGRVRRGEGTVGKLFSTDEAHDKLVGALGSVESGLDELKNTLGRVGRIGLEVGVSTEYQSGHDFDPTIQFDDNTRTGVQVLLRPTRERNLFYNVELNTDPDGKIKEKIKKTTVTDPVTGESKTIVTTELKREREMVFSAQAGWRMDQFGLRAGMFDATGGFGVDWYMDDKRLQFTGDAFDFGGKYDDQPQLRLQGRYLLFREQKNFPGIYLSTGVDDALNDAAFTVGASIRWTDDDLKYLLGTGAMN